MSRFRVAVWLEAIATSIVLQSTLPAGVALAAGPDDELLARCEACHGKGGYSQDPEVPIIAGFSYIGFIDTLTAFREDQRIGKEYRMQDGQEKRMNDIARSLSEAEVESLARYFSERPFKAPVQAFDEALARQGAVIHEKHCEKCHSDGGSNPQDDAAILAGQWMPYLIRQFRNIKTGKRLVPRSMQRRVDQLSAADKTALVHFYGSANRSFKP